VSQLATVAPEWIESTLVQRDGRDPLGLQTTTQDRLMPALLPDINELTRRARYFSFYAFLLGQFEEERRPATRTELSSYIKAREYELGLAVLRCPRGCGSSPVGAMRLRGIANGEATQFERGESVESANGGYGLYYRSSMIAFDLSVPAGTPLGEATTPIDVLARRDKARQLATAFREAVSDTDYYRRYLASNDPIPAGVIAEYAEVACLCRLDQFTNERELITSTMLQAPHEQLAGAVEQRRRSMAHYLSLLDDRPEIHSDNATFRAALWAPATLMSEVHHDVADQWAALVLKDLFQDAVCSLWTHFLRESLASEGQDGLTRAHLDDVLIRLADGPPTLEPGAPTIEQLETFDLPREHAEQLRRQVAEADSATVGLAALAALPELVGSRDTVGWRQATSVASAWQPSVAQVATEIEAHLATGPAVHDTMRWAIRRLILMPHERIAYSKLPEFTFRFRAGAAGLRFYDLDHGRFILAGIRHPALGTLTQDLGYWRTSDDGTHEVTERGREFVQDVLA
jgi:hypothetical protein